MREIIKREEIERRLISVEKEMISYLLNKCCTRATYNIP